ncbi:MAG: hypothetical protein QM486_09795 [Flavobacteriaceae bacterium]
MRKILVFISLLVAFQSCNLKKDNKKKQEPIMYKPSEMALLMRGMYEFNNVLKMQIINKDSLLPFPEEFVNIHSAVLTDKFERNDEFDSLSKKYLIYQKAIYTSRSDSTAYFFNQSIQTCVTCHEPRCTGPIPKIKKLLIPEM